MNTCLGGLCPTRANFTTSIGSFPSLIVDMRRYLVLEESSAPAQINSMFANIENNGAPWPIAQTERMNWAQDIYADTE